ncbi:hypothetical protein K431DRAFT_104224 [Polychaeton citri CBS 116435]|uniref:Secreted protein n=1 Tax=Polychaeton citri CBS 116435 TaxID=1314669 RepID=A0A9P4UNM8_9PEZI|nr:hypothetical protein K431DRAFT_104224 [Polychaeton citri CBS 116435]
MLCCAMLCCTVPPAVVSVHLHCLTVWAGIDHTQAGEVATAAWRGYHWVRLCQPTRASNSLVRASLSSQACLIHSSQDTDRVPYLGIRYCIWQGQNTQRAPRHESPSWTGQPLPPANSFCTTTVGSVEYPCIIGKITQHRSDANSNMLHPKVFILADCPHPGLGIAGNRMTPL